MVESPDELPSASKELPLVRNHRDHWTRRAQELYGEAPCLPNLPLDFPDLLLTAIVLQYHYHGRALQAPGRTIPGKAGTLQGELVERPTPTELDCDYAFVVVAAALACTAIPASSSSPFPVSRPWIRTVAFPPSSSIAFTALR